MDRFEYRRLLRRAGIAVALFVALLGAGTAAFSIAAGEGLEEAFYRSLSAFTTSSLYDAPRTSEERAIAAVLSIAGGLFYLLLVGGVVQTLLGHVFTEALQRRRMTAAIADLNHHYVVCGYGRVGRAVVRALLDDGKNVVVVEKKPDNWAAIEREPRFRKSLFLLKGDADDDKILKDANLDAAAGVVTCVGSDAMNVYIALAARRCYKNIPIVARASDEIAEKNLAEATHILNEAVTPYTSAGRTLADAVVKHGHKRPVTR